MASSLQWGLRRADQVLVPCLPLAFNLAMIFGSDSSLNSRALFSRVAIWFSLSLVSSIMFRICKKPLSVAGSQGGTGSDLWVDGRELASRATE